MLQIQCYFTEVENLYNFFPKLKTFHVSQSARLKVFLYPSRTIVSLIYNVLKTFMEMNSKLFDDLTASYKVEKQKEMKRERERADLWRGLDEYQERRMQMLTEAARNQRNLQERGERGDTLSPSSLQTAQSDQHEPKPSGASTGAGESAT
ncbi:hypothetical protein AMECASPLE_035730 [Ameca splendens]|uniref:Uncharacterized protein n=1 Tax=Ameca splendens TaxID=208324 RepID=A0ABV0XKH1_9TELE